MLVIKRGEKIEDPTLVGTLLIFVDLPERAFQSLNMIGLRDEDEVVTHDSEGWLREYLAQQMRCYHWSRNRRVDDNYGFDTQVTRSLISFASG